MDLLGDFDPPPTARPPAPPRPLPPRLSHRRTQSTVPLFDDLLTLSPLAGSPARPHSFHPSHTRAASITPSLSDFTLTPATHPANLVSDSDSDSDFGEFASAPRKARRPLPGASAPPDAFPPVAALLAAFPALFALPQKHLLEKLRGQPYELRQRVLADPRTREFLGAVCEFGRVAGRIIAGRRRRQRRRGGVEERKEEREVKEVVRLWAETVPRLRAVVGGAVPVIAESAMRGEAAEGVCKLCRLGRGEVVEGLKEETGRRRWWVEGWGHGGCKGFWGKHGEEVRRARY